MIFFSLVSHCFCFGNAYDLFLFLLLLFLFVVCACILCLLPCLTSVEFARCSFIYVSCIASGVSQINYLTCVPVPVQPPCAIACIDICAHVENSKRWQPHLCMEAKRLHTLVSVDSTHWCQWTAHTGVSGQRTLVSVDSTHWYQWTAHTGISGQRCSGCCWTHRGQ